MSPTSRDRALRAAKALHSLVWAFFTACIVALPIAAWRGELALALWLIAVVFLEVLVLSINRWRCPLTAVAARYTDDRRENFDIYLPRWLAKYNQQIFGTLYVAGVIYAVYRCVRTLQ